MKHDEELRARVRAKIVESLQKMRDDTGLYVGGPASGEVRPDDDEVVVDGLVDLQELVSAVISAVTDKD